MDAQHPSTSEDRPGQDRAQVSISAPAESASADMPDGRPPDSLGKRLLQPRTLVSFGLAAFFLYFIFRRLDDPAEVWRQIRGANFALVALAVVIYYSSFLVRSVRWLRMLRQAGVRESNGYRMPGVGGTYSILILSWFANCVAPARLGDAYRGFLLKDRTGASFSVGLGTILAERLIDLVVLVGIVLGSGMVVFGTHAPGRAEQAFLFGLIVVVVGVMGAIVLYLLRNRFERHLPERFSGHFHRLQRGIFDNLRRPLPFGAVSVLIWLSDGLRLYLIAWSLGASLTYTEALMVALLSALVTIIPITPAGVGVVEGFMIWLLPQVGVPADTAAAIAILDRVVTYWSLIAVGLPLYLANWRRGLQSTEGPGEQSGPDLGDPGQRAVSANG